jgi:hypothetical protein
MIFSVTRSHGIRTGNFLYTPYFSIHMSLTLSSTLSPFPYAAAALAAHTKQAELVFDDTSTDVSLDLSGAVISGEEKIVGELAKAGGLSSDSTAVGINF